MDVMGLTSAQTGHDFYGYKKEQSNRNVATNLSNEILFSFVVLTEPKVKKVILSICLEKEFNKEQSSG